MNNSRRTCIHLFGTQDVLEQTSFYQEHMECTLFQNNTRAGNNILGPAVHIITKYLYF